MPRQLPSIIHRRIRPTGNAGRNHDNVGTGQSFLQSVIFRKIPRNFLFYVILLPIKEVALYLLTAIDEM